MKFKIGDQVIIINKLLVDETENDYFIININKDLAYPYRLSHTKELKVPINVLECEIVKNTKLNRILYLP